LKEEATKNWQTRKTGKFERRRKKEETTKNGMKNEEKDEETRHP
jgi:hypothetical protein